MIASGRLTGNEHTVIAQAIAELDRRLVGVLDSRKGEHTKAEAEWKHYVCRSLLDELHAL